MHCSPTLAARLAQLVRMLATNHIGELAAARDALLRTLHGIGADLNDLAEVVERAAAAPTKPEPELGPDDFRHMAEVLLSHHNAVLTDWDRTFLGGVIKWRSELSPKQKQKVVEIVSPCR